MMNKLKTEMMKALKVLMGDMVSSKVWTAEELIISEKVVGGKVEILGADSTLSNAPDGDYEMADGFKFTVKDSLIESIDGEEAPEDKAEETVVEAAEDAPAEDAPASDNIQEIVDAIAPMFEEMKASIDAIRADVDALKGVDVAASKEDVDKFTKQVEDLTATIKLLAKIPVEASKTTQSNTVKESREDKLVAMARMLGAK